MFKVFKILSASIMMLKIIFASAHLNSNCEVGKYFELGSAHALDGGKLQQAAHELRMILVKLAEEGDGFFYRLSTVYSGLEQIVEGSLRTLNVELIDFNNVKHDCVVDMWTRPWLRADTEVTIKCKCMRTVVKHVDIMI